jgi:nucleoside-diphosphate-sugar epimerase
VILVTGASGFVGARLLQRLHRQERRAVTAAIRRPQPLQSGDPPVVVIPGLDATTDWSPALAGADVIVHLAARVHVMRDAASDPLQEFRRINVAGTINLARQAAAQGVRRFVFVSSIKVNGEITAPGCRFSADLAPAPQDPYGISKLEAENGLKEVARQAGMELVTIRPPLVYGPGVKGNFRSMMRWLHAGIPLPLGAIHNQRSLVALDNLVDVLVACIDHPGAANQTFLVSDDEDLSTTDLLRRLASAIGRSARLVTVPPKLLTLAAGLLGRQDLWQRLCGSLRVDIAKTRQLLGWSPCTSVDQGLRLAAEAFLSETRV